MQNPFTGFGLPQCLESQFDQQQQKQNQLLHSLLCYFHNLKPVESIDAFSLPFDHMTFSHVKRLTVTSLWHL